MSGEVAYKAVWLGRPRLKSDPITLVILIRRLTLATILPSLPLLVCLPLLFNLTQLLGIRVW